MSYFAELTSKRRATLAISGVLWLASLVWLIQTLLRTPPTEWSVALAIVMTTLGAFSSAAVVVEMFRPFFRATAGWADREHFRCVVVVFIVFAAIQNAGILGVMSSYGVHAF